MFGIIQMQYLPALFHTVSTVSWDARIIIHIDIFQKGKQKREHFANILDQFIHQNKSKLYFTSPQRSIRVFVLLIEYENSDQSSID